MENCNSEKHNQVSDFAWAFGLNRFSLRLMGIWPSDESVQSRSLQSVIRISIITMIMIFGLLLPQIYALTLCIHQLSLVIDNLLTSSPTFTSCIKLFFIWHNSLVLKPVVESAARDWYEVKDNLKLKIMKSQAARARLVTIIDYVILSCCYTGFVVSPFVDFDMRLINNMTDYGERNLLVQSYYPYDYSKSPNFELTQCFQLMGSFFVGMAVSVPDDYFGALVFHASAQFDILGRDIEHFLRAKYRCQLDDVAVNRKLKAFIDRHVHLNRMVFLIEQAFSYVIAAQMFCMSTMVCCLGFQILGMLEDGAERPDSLQLVTLVGTLFTMMVHTLVNCFASETLASHSKQIYFRICNSNWYYLPPSTARCLIPMLIASRTSRQIKAGKILLMSMTTYCSIIKSTTGYISMLIAVSSR
ncbi:uncharacterized protein LOC131666670 [Phymastichus coffea]|uniref:uncharacterized protein LOC131666670 n=1 Tax=Phymastichus coffea TaxID=108790 RepID=UPI00273C216E|nr:uncharacterized protein LOC131666670 [Phymastichus coffea]